MVPNKENYHQSSTVACNSIIEHGTKSMPNEIENDMYINTE